MVNLRYHIVSIVAVFLALAVGIVVGSTVVDRAIVNSLNDRLNAVEARANATDAENERLGDELETLREFSEQARDALVSGVLAGRPVLVVTVQGVDRDPVEHVVESLVEAAAEPAGTLVLTNGLLLRDDDDVATLADVLGVASTVPEILRRQALDRVASVLGGSPADPGLLPALAEAGFLAFDEPPARPPAPATTASPPTTTSPSARSTGRTLSSLPIEGLAVVVVSGADAVLADQLLIEELVAPLVEESQVPLVVAAEVVPDDPEVPATFVPVLRAHGSLAARLSTVDNLASPAGQAAVVLALRDLADSRTGHYGVGPGAQRQLPTLAA